MSLVVIGSIAFDSVRTPFGERERMLGGSAVHFSLAASFFTDVRVVGPVGDDFGDAEYAVLHDRGVDTSDIERVPGGRTFFWAGEYGYDLNARDTLDTQLGVFGEFDPKLSEESRAAEMLFLGNIQPDLQYEVRRQCDRARLTGLDSMNLWIETTRESLLRVVGEVDLLFLNDIEVRELINLASYNYLGISYRPEVRKAAIEALERYGLGASGSPILPGTFDIHVKLAEAVAKAFE